MTLEVGGGRAEFTVTATLANGSARPWNAARLTLDAPSGRVVHARSAATAPRLGAGEPLTAHGQVTRPEVSTATTLTCRGTARHEDDEVTYTATAALS
ncbi:NEW3 domain-containing protein [Streptomyces sp. NPDC048417]|uniref:NEW3 domain-containing protein n=1 Tax=Streptomyces sp. NPDC048417 TaxID=3155387 RepID=UPI003432B230